jgi:hypothetical protein
VDWERKSEGTLPSLTCWLIKDFGGPKDLSGKGWSERI